VLGKFAGENKTHGSLDFSGSDGGFFVVASESRRFLSELLKDVIDEAVHDPHGLAGDPNVRVNLLEDLENVDFVGLNTLCLSLLLLVSGGSILRNLLLSLRFLSRSLLCRFFLCGFLLTLGHGFLTEGLIRLSKV